MKLVEVGGHNQFREMEIGQVRGLLNSSVIVDCKRVLDEDSRVVYFGYRKR